MTPKVSVLVIAYNHEPYIRAALESVYGQKTTFPVEVLICDDASTDGTRRVIEEFAAMYPDRTRAMLREKNLGTKGETSNALLGFEACLGQYIAPLEGDDYWTDIGKLQRQADFLDARPEYSMCFHNCEVRYDDGDGESWELCSHALPERLTTADLLTPESDGMFIGAHASATMMRREVVQKLRERPRHLSDWLTGILASQIGPLGYIDRVMSAYRQHTASYWSSRTRADQWAAFVEAYDDLKHVLGEAYLDTLERGACVRSYVAAMEYERQGSFANAAKYLARALRGQPAWLEAYAAGYGFTNDEFFRVLSKRLRLYRVPVLLRISSGLARLRAEVSWRRLQAGVRARSRQGLERGEARGVLSASPNPALASSRNPGLARVALQWTATAADTVEVRLEKPDGSLFSRTAGSGEGETGEWVRDGAIFYLQDVSHGLPLTHENTLDVVRIGVRERGTR